MKIPFMCPACNGHGTVSKPPWVAGDKNIWWADSIQLYPCAACNGSGIIWASIDDSMTNESKGYEVKP